MPPNKLSGFKKTATAAAILTALVPLAAQGEAGRVNFTMGEVQATGPDGSKRALSKGSIVLSGETITTSSGGMAHIRFRDGAYVSLKPNSNFRIDEYRYKEEKAEESRGFFSLLKGGLRTITGLIGKQNNDSYRMSSEVATIGIRGTHYEVDVGEGGKQGKTAVQNYVDSDSIVLKINPEFELLSGEKAVLQPIFLPDGASVVEITLTDRAGEETVYQVDTNGRVRTRGQDDFLSAEESAILLGERISDPDSVFSLGDSSDDSAVELGDVIQRELDDLCASPAPYCG